MGHWIWGNRERRDLWTVYLIFRKEWKGMPAGVGDSDTAMRRGWFVVCKTLEQI